MLPRPVYKKRDSAPYTIHDIYLYTHDIHIYVCIYIPVSVCLLRHLSHELLNMLLIFISILILMFIRLFSLSLSLALLLHCLLWRAVLKANSFCRKCRTTYWGGPSTYRRHYLLTYPKKQSCSVVFVAVAAFCCCCLYCSCCCCGLVEGDFYFNIYIRL